MLNSIKTKASLAALFAAALALPGAAQAAVTVLGWPGGSEETALRAAVETYNAKDTVAADDKVELLFFNRDGFYDKLQADMAAGSDAFDINLLATYAIGRYAPYMDPVDLGADAVKVLRRGRAQDDAVSTASSTACRPTCRCTSCTIART